MLSHSWQAFKCTGSFRGIKFLLLALSCLFLTSCAYKWGHGDRTIPGGYKQIAIPVFKNYTQEPGIEVDFTSAIRDEFENAKVARVAPLDTAEVVLVGEITSLGYTPSVPNVGGTLPTGTVLAASYNINLTVRLTLKKRSDNKVLWNIDLTGGRSYTSPQVTVAGVNTVNPLYNLSARRQNIQQMSLTMMAEAHDRITENF